VTVNAETMEVDIDGEIIKADVCNVIPAQKAGADLPTIAG
jgi:sulfide dehydrogenase [flavocytochrome c] flavoprotein subunit